MTNPETPLEIAKEWVAELAVMTSDLDETIKVKASDIRALARALIEAEELRQEWAPYPIIFSHEGFAKHNADIRTDERARIVAAIRTQLSLNRNAQELGDWIERGCPHV